MTNAAAIESGWTDCLHRGERPDAESLRSHLLAVHEVHTGFTESCAAGCRDREGRNSYEWLSEAVPRDAGSVLDMACGSGVLLQVCRRRLGHSVALVGIDMSPDEVALARARLPAGGVTLHQALAQSMVPVADASVDAVLCHWALTLIDPVAPAMAEVGRVLRPGGTFAAIVDGPMEIAPGYAEVDGLIFAAVRQAYPHYGDIDLGDPRVRDTSALSTLCAEAFPGAEIRIESSVMTVEGTAKTVASEAAGFFYAAFVLSPAARAAMLQDLAQQLATQAAGGTCRFHMPVNRLCVRLPS
ncbi:MAG: methyltransferase domain-containing protein [Pseudomonadota bacterium]